jgi:hypothetical protein
MLADYLKAAIPTPTIILGQRLRSFSLGHNMILLRHENSFLGEQAKIHVGDLSLGIFVCCHEYDEALEQLERPDLGEILKEWGKRSAMADFKAKAREFHRYLRDGSALPDFVPVKDGKEGRTPGAPFLQLVKVTLMSEVGYSRWEALNVPLSEALNDYFAHWERKGRVEILNPEERAERIAAEKEHFDQVEAIRKEIQGEGGWHAL